MPRIIGVDIPNDKRIVVALTYIFGIGDKRSQDILKAVGIDASMRAKNLSDEEVGRIATYIEQHYTVEGYLRREVAQNISRLKDIGCWRGLRHRRGLPVRGQRTKTNARTRKGKRRTVAVKRSVKALHT